MQIVFIVRWMSHEFSHIFGGSKRNITINYYQYREESHNSQLPAERIIYARLEAPRDYVTTQETKKIEGQPFIYLVLCKWLPSNSYVSKETAFGHSTVYH